MIKVIYDWNGTMFDDVRLSFECLRHLTEKYKTKQVHTIKEYREVFNFPVIDYYKALGFDFTKLDWDKVANEYMDDYISHTPEVSLFEDVLLVMKEVRDLGLENIVLSASKMENLVDQLNLFDFDSLIDGIYGLSDIYANSKESLAQRLKEESKPEDLLIFLGDTLHDAMVADSIGAACLLIDRGHQSRERLKQSGKPVFSSLMQALDYIKETYSKEIEELSQKKRENEKEIEIEEAESL